MARQTEADIIVEVPVEVAYRAWSDFESFPRFMSNVSAVRRVDPQGRRLHWIATVGGTALEWDAEVTELTPNQRVAWRSISGSANDGTVELEPDGDRTHVTVRMRYDPPIGIAGDAAESLVLATKVAIQDDLRTFKQLIETGTSWRPGTFTWARWAAIGTAGAAVLIGASIGTWYGLTRRRAASLQAARLAPRRNAVAATSLARRSAATQASYRDAARRQDVGALWYWVGIGAATAAAGLRLTGQPEWSLPLGQLSTLTLLLAIYHKQARGACQV